MLELVVQSRQLTDVPPCPNKHANMTPVADPRLESRIVTNRDRKTRPRSSANNMLITRQSDVPRASFENKSDLRRE
jgi:hypothetical protein